MEVHLEWLSAVIPLVGCSRSLLHLYAEMKLCVEIRTEESLVEFVVKIRLVAASLQS